jgi:hypothetical protein
MPAVVFLLLFAWARGMGKMDLSVAVGAWGRDIGVILIG